MGCDDFASSTLHSTPRWCMFRLIHPFHSIWTLSIYHHKYDEWLEKVEVGTWALEWSSQCVFEVRVGSKLALHLPTFRTKIVWVWTGPSNSQHLNPCILSPIVYQMVLQGQDWNYLSTTTTTITTPRLLSCGLWVVTTFDFASAVPYIPHQ